MPCSSHTTSQTFCPSGYRTGPPACKQSRAKKRPEGREHAGEKRRGGAEKRKKNIRVVVFHGKHRMPVARARVSQTGVRHGFATPPSRAVSALQGTLFVGGFGRDVISFCAGEEPLGRRTAGRLYPSRRCTFDEFKSFAGNFTAGAPSLMHV
jgi:hypothetical protein